MKAGKKQKFKNIGFGKVGNISYVPNEKPFAEILKTPVQELIKLPLPVMEMGKSTLGELIIYA